MTPPELLAQAARLEARARTATGERERLQLCGEALMCRGLAWILSSAEINV